MSNGSFWTPQQWAQFNGVPGDKTQPGLLKATIGPMEVAQQVFPTIVTGSDYSILGDKIDLATGRPSTGGTRAFATLQKPFILFDVHIKDPALTMASNQVTLAGQALGLAEDSLFFLGRDAQLRGGAQAVTLPPGDQDKLERGLLGIAEANNVIQVSPGRKKTYGLATYRAVVKGIAKFTDDQQGPPYALILSPDTFADANLPLEDDAMVTPSSAIQALLRSGPLVTSPGMPNRTGLLASKGGKTTTLYIGTGPLVGPDTIAGSLYSFTARESIQFLNIDSRSLIKLEFEEIVP
jgi:hypothetical protein